MRDFIRRGLVCLLSSAGLLAFSPIGLTQPASTASAYTVEVIVFRNNGPREVGIGGTPPLRGAEESDTPPAAAQPLQGHRDGHCSGPRKSEAQHSESFRVVERRRWLMRHLRIK